MVLRRPARPRRARPAPARRARGGARRVLRRPASAPLPPPEAAPAALRHAPPRRRPRRPVDLPPHHHLPRGAGEGRATRRRARADVVRGRRVRRAPARRGARRRRPPDDDVRAPQGRVRRLGGRRELVHDGDLLPRPAAPLRRAHGGRLTGRRHLEPRPRQPRDAAEEAADPRRRGPVVAHRGRHRRAGPGRPRRDGPRHRRRRRPALFAVTPDEAQQALRQFVDHRLDPFGPYEDAVLAGDSTMAHSLLSVPLNLGVLHPLDAVACRRAGAPRRHGPAELRRGLRPPDPRLARVHLAPLLALREGLPAQQPARGPHRRCRPGGPSSTATPSPPPASRTR